MLPDADTMALRIATDLGASERDANGLTCSGGAPREAAKVEAMRPWWKFW